MKVHNHFLPMTSVSVYYCLYETNLVLSILHGEGSSLFMCMFFGKFFVSFYNYVPYCFLNGCQDMKMCIIYNKQYINAIIVTVNILMKRPLFCLSMKEPEK